MKARSTRYTTQKAARANRIQRCVSVVATASCLAMSACVSSPKLPPPPPRYIYQTNSAEDAKPALSGSNSLWRDAAGLFEDVKARRVNDLILINVTESITGSGTADTSATRKSSIDASVTSLLGLPTNLNLGNAFGKGNTFTPKATGGMTNDFAGTGSTDRAGKLVGTITAKIVEVMPNGTLAIESRKELTINNEKQILILRGMVRPDDIAIDNSVASNRVADAEVFFVGDGVLQGKQHTGWLADIFDKVWPF